VRRGHAPGLHCPYCYQAFSARDILFRCSGRIGPVGRRCGPEPDKVLSKHTGREEILPPHFESGGQPGPGVCPDCKATTPVRICPACHRRLPAQFGDVRSRLIALAGAKESGKTVFMTVVLHELMHRLGEQLRASIGAADDHTRTEFARLYDLPMYRGSQLLAPTPAAGANDRAPLVFRLTVGGPGPRAQNCRHGRGLHGKARPTPAVLALFDPAGEELRSALSVEEYARYLAAVDDIVLLLDPLQMPAARELAAPGTRLPSPATSADAPAAVLQSITDVLLRSGQAGPDGLIGKPLAIALSKIDTIQDALGETSPLRQPPAQTCCFDERDSLRVHSEVQRLLVKWDGSLIDRLARQHYRDFRYFGISALGETPTDDNRVSARHIQPYRAGEPLTWLLSRVGVIPTQRG
jgi:hypothetical protein